MPPPAITPLCCPQPPVPTQLTGRAAQRQGCPAPGPCFLEAGPRAWPQQNGGTRRPGKGQPHCAPRAGKEASGPGSLPPLGALASAWVGAQRLWGQVLSGCSERCQRGEGLYACPPLPHRGALPLPCRGAGLAPGLTCWGCWPGPSSGKGRTLVCTMPGLWSRTCSSVAAMSISFTPRAEHTRGQGARSQGWAPEHMRGMWRGGCGAEQTRGSARGQPEGQVPRAGQHGGARENGAGAGRQDQAT